MRRKKAHTDVLLTLEPGVQIMGSSVRTERDDGFLRPGGKRLAETPLDEQLLDDLRAPALEDGEGRWRYVEVFTDASVFLGIVLLDPALPEAERAAAFTTVKGWVHASDSTEGEGWSSYFGDEWLFGDWELVHELRVFPSQAMAILALGESPEVIAGALATLRVSGRAPWTRSATRTGSLDEVLSPISRTRLEGAAGPATARLQRLASASRSPDLHFEAKLVSGGEFGLFILGGDGEPSWNPSRDSNPPGGGTLAQMKELMAGYLAGESLLEVTRAEVKRPRVTAEQQAEVATWFAGLVGEHSTLVLPPAPRSRKRTRRK